MDLQGLELVDWSRLEHAEGPADDVPRMLRTIASPNPPAEEFEQLFERLIYEGSLYSATPAVIPFLLQLIGDSGYYSLIHFLDVVADSSDDRTCCDEETAARVLRELESGVRAIAGVLESGDAEDRSAAARTLGRLGGQARAAVAAVRARLEVEKEPSVKAALGLALVELDSSSELEEDAPPVVLFRAAEQSARKMGPATDDAALAQLARHWREAALQHETSAAVLIEIANRLEPARRLDFLCELLPGSPRAGDAVAISTHILITAFEDRRAGWDVSDSRMGVFVNGKRWSPRQYEGSPFPGVTAEECRAFQERFKKTGSEQTAAVMKEFKAMQARRPDGAVERAILHYAHIVGERREWQLPFTPKQKRAISAIAASDLSWDCETNLWALFGLPSAREELARLAE
jgi:hypothetical protein